MKRQIFLAFLFVGLAFGTVKNAQAQGYDSALNYDDGTNLQGYSEIYDNPYSEWEDCQSWSTDGGDNGDGVFCLLDYLYEPWLSLYGNLNGNEYGSGMGDGGAVVFYYVPYPGNGDYTASLNGFIGETEWENDCIDVDNCNGPYYVDWWLLASGFFAQSDTVQIQHVTSAAYSPSSFYAPGSSAVIGNCNGCEIDFKYSFTDTSQNTFYYEEDSWPNGYSSTILATQPQYFGTYTLLQVKNHADSGTWAWVPLAAGITLNIYPPPPPTFTLSITPSGGSMVDAGSPATYTVSVNGANGFAGQVSLSVPLPSGVTASFSPATAAVGSPSTMTLLTSSTGSTGLFSLTVTGASGSLSSSASTSLRIVPAYNIVLNAFIPWAWIYDGLACASGANLTYGYTIAHGDNRSFSQYAGMSQRVQQQLTIQPVSGRVLLTAGAPQQSTQNEHYSSVGTDTTGTVVPQDDQIYKDCYLTNQIGTASYTPGVNPGITPRGTPPTASEEFTGNVSYPFNVAAPGIKWDITLSLTPQANSGKTNFTILNNGHTCFPAFEINVNNIPVYQYSPQSNDFWNYVTPCLLGYNSSGQSTMIYQGNSGAINQ